MKLIKLTKLALLSCAGVFAMSTAASADPISATIVIGLGIAQTSAYFATAVAVTNFVIGTVASVGLSLLGQALTQKPKMSGGSVTEMRFTADAYRTIPFGTVAVAGRRVYWRGNSKKNKQLWIVDQLADWECNALKAVWVDGVRTTLTPIAIVGTEAARYEVDGFGGKFRVKFFRGTMTQAADTELIAAESDGNGARIGAWTSNHRGAGVCYVSWWYAYSDSENTTQVPNLLWEIEGAKLYDWRKDSTNGGTGAHRWNDPTTWEFSDNPAVASYNFRRGFYRNGIRIHGIGVPVYDLLHAEYTTAANICDEVVSEGGGSETRYRLSFISNDDAEHRIALDACNAAMAGEDLERVGQFGVIAGAAYSSVATLTDDDMIAGAPFAFKQKKPFAEIYNAVHVSWLNPNQPWSSDVLTPLTDAGYEAQDGNQRIARDLDLPMVTKPYQARRIGKIVQEQSRMQAVHTGVYGTKATRLEPGDWITRVFNRDSIGGAGSMVMSIVTKRLVGINQWELVLRQAAASTFTAPGGTFTVPPVPTIVDATQAPDPPTSLSATTSVFKAIRLSWTPPAEDFDQMQVWVANTNDRAGASLLAIARSTYFIHTDLPAPANRYYWIKAMNAEGVESAFYPASATGGIMGSSVTVAPGDLAPGAAGPLVVTSLPAVTVADDGFVVLLTTDKKVYYVAGGVWVPADDLVVAARIVAASLSAISANIGSITAGTITSPGGMLIDVTNNLIRSGNFAEDADGEPVAGWRLNAAGEVKAYAGRFTDLQGRGATFVKRPILSDTPIFIGGIPLALAVNQGRGSVEEVRTTANNLRMTAVSQFHVRTPTSMYMYANWWNGSTSWYQQGQAPIAPGQLLPEKLISFQDGNANQIEYRDDGKIYQVLRDGNGVVTNTYGIETAFSTMRWMYDLEMDPLNTRGLSKIIGGAGMNRLHYPFVIPACSQIEFKMWGAGGGHSLAGGTFGGPGGYTIATFDVDPADSTSGKLKVGDLLWIIIGDGGERYNPSKTIGFGGAGQADSNRWSGGGLTGVFRGLISRATALCIAGGGGAGHQDADGSPGNHTTWAGGQSGSGIALMTGIDWNYTSSVSRAAGGGGHTGGTNLTFTVAGDRGGRGGTGYVDTAFPGYVSHTISFTATDSNGYANSRVPPNTGDSDYNANRHCWRTHARVGYGASSLDIGSTESAGNGLIVITLTP
jgi:hypothetical protein